MASACPLCRPRDERLVYAEEEVRVVLVDEADYPGYCRVVWKAHVTEMTDLAPEQYTRLMVTVLAVEEALRAVLEPTKINLASLGNLVPHLHWHVIPRFTDDPHFPQSIWGPRQREPDRDRLVQRRSRLDALCTHIVARISARR